LPDSTRVITEVVAKNNTKDNKQAKRCDLMVFHVEPSGILFELVANAPKDEVIEHCHRAAEYKATLKASGVWVLNFTAFSEDPTYHYMKSPIPEVNLVHFYHNRNLLSQRLCIMILMVKKSAT